MTGSSAFPAPLEVALALPLPAGIDPAPWLAADLGLPSWPQGDPRTRAFDRYLRRPELHPRLVEWSRARFLALPFDWEATLGRDELRLKAQAAAQRGAAAGKTTLVFHWHDSTAPVDLPGAVTFRTSLERGPRYLRSEHCMPAWTEEPAPEPAFDLPWRPRPIISFCGNVGRTGSGVRALARRARRRVEMVLSRHHPGLRGLAWSDPYALRRAALRALERSPRVETRFVRRESFFGGAVDVDTRAWDTQRLALARSEYQHNLSAGDYVLCVRGAGNFSHRLFEALAVGKVPVLVDTEGGLPWEVWYPWARKILIVPAHQLPSLPARLRAFHDRLGPEGLRELQAELRRFHAEWLTPEGFFGRLRRHFEPGAV